MRKEHEEWERKVRRDSRRKQALESIKIFVLLASVIIVFLGFMVIVSLPKSPYPTTAVSNDPLSDTRAACRTQMHGGSLADPEVRAQLEVTLRKLDKLGEFRYILASVQSSAERSDVAGAGEKMQFLYQELNEWCAP